jgi:protein-tyrosine phosphatase
MMVCLGNICRSPMAQGILENKIKENNLEIEVESAGTANYHVGDPPDNRAAIKMKNEGIDISAYKGRQFSETDFDEFDLIFAMDEYNFRDVMQLTRTDEDGEKVELILNRIYPKKDMSVPDPYYGGDEGFNNVYNLLDKACDKIIEDLMYG